MHAQLIATCHELMQSLQTLPGDIASQQVQLLEMEREARTLAQAIETTEHAFIANVGGWKSLGSNDKERELRLAEFAHADKAAFQLAQQKRERDFSIDRTRQVIAGLERRYGAVCYQVRLHAALLQYLGQAGAPVQMAGVMTLPSVANGAGSRSPAGADVNFYAAKDADVTAIDAANIGL